LSNLEIYIDDNEKAFLNGTVKFLVHVNGPLEVISTGYKLNRGQWSIMGSKRFEDFCKNIHSPHEPHYVFFKNNKGCPLKPGVSKL